MDRGGTDSFFPRDGTVCLMLCSKNVAGSHRVGGLQNMAGQKCGLHPICSWGPTDYSQAHESPLDSEKIKPVNPKGHHS